MLLRGISSIVAHLPTFHPFILRRALSAIYSIGVTHRHADATRAPTTSLVTAQRRGFDYREIACSAQSEDLPRVGGAVGNLCCTPTARTRLHTLRNTGAPAATLATGGHSTAPRLQLPGGSRQCKALLQRKPRVQTWHHESPCKRSDTPSQQHSTHWVQLRQQQMERKVVRRTACPHARPHHNVTARHLDSGSAALPYRGRAC